MVLQNIESMVSIYFKRVVDKNVSVFCDCIADDIRIVNFTLLQVELLTNAVGHLVVRHWERALFILTHKDVVTHTIRHFQFGLGNDAAFRYIFDVVVGQTVDFDVVQIEMFVQVSFSTSFFRGSFIRLQQHNTAFGTLFHE